ncbi:TetR family transcriptional regulator [Ktedonobacter sp. SOSP1-52]|uniref:TetR/AcrR family transcriptional regulator n=1 Tax=Ktedonobacter sp. SOSP1-52 TaxID=2778366 RepID=UPI0019161A6C|nr:TetR/AcrR family transcriptional regulator [Ktedonobacter sp. SOSP1-52]GHO61198.1 TetR family transcriptional regulator [Ktedonobacter sp. SOSP1-52]
MKQQKRDRRSQRTQRLVSSAFTELMIEKSYEKILVQDILDRAGIGRTTFYAHYFDKEDVLNHIIEQELAMLTGHIAQAAQGQRIIPSLELFVHAYVSTNQQLRALICSSAGNPLLDALQAALCRLIEPTRSTLCAERRSPPIPLPVVSEYLAGAFLTLFKWWVTADMPYPPEQMESIFQQLALPGVRAMLKEK